MPRRHGGDAAKLQVSGELGNARRQLRPLHRLLMQQGAHRGRPAASLRERRGEDLLQVARRRTEGLLLRELRQVLIETGEAVPLQVPSSLLRSGYSAVTAWRVAGATPLSVMKPVTSRAGVTSKP